ncbi:Vitellogenin-1 [Acropora cervicornis]|uniref:Vitellogenin-1 n=1 Tax=Acropora cervicornis TaxID=6130 RepID=A0AAD9Q8L5_ACRCE|nr:Vitellogenin-1 [Acropora cervicornis]
MHLGYKVGQRYTHSYECDVTKAMPGSSTKTVGLQLKCDAHVDVITKTEMQVTLANIQVNPVQGTRTNPTQQKDNLKQNVLQAMQQQLLHPVKFFIKASDGSINKLRVHPKDTDWSLNVKRGLVNLFQISGPLDQQYFIQPEVRKSLFVVKKASTAVGECQVAYTIRRRTNAGVLELTKVINYNKCQHRAEFKQVNYLGEACQECQQSLGYSPYHRAVGQIDHTLTGSKDKGYTINRAEAYEDHVITPLSRAAGQFTARARQTLKFLKNTAAGAPSTELTETVRMTFSAENPEAFSKYEKQQQQKIVKARECIQEMFKAAKDIAGPNVGEKFAATVYALRRCTKETLKTLVDEMVKRKDRRERKLFLDAASFVGTCQAFEVLKENAQLFKTSELSRLFLGLAATPEPRACHIKALRDLCNHKAVTADQSCHRQCLLSSGAVLNKISRRPSFQQNPKDVSEYDNSLKEMRSRLNRENAKSDEKRMYIQALGNAGSCQVQDDLQNILKNKEQPLFVRVECVWALRRITRQTRGKAKAYPCLISIFADPEESPELRMAIFVQILNTGPNFPTLQALASIVRREVSIGHKGPQSNQLASFVFSHLFALAYNNNILTKRRAMQARLVLRLMPEMKFGLSYSKGVRMAFNSEKYQSGIEIEANKLDLPDSGLPRNLNARLRFNILGYRLNALEFGARIENMDDIVDYIASKIRKRSKRSLWGSIASIFNPEEMDDSDGYSPTVDGNKSSQGSPIPISSDKEIKQRRMSAFVKFFGNEMTFLEVRQKDVDQLAQDLSDLLVGPKTKLEYPEQGIVITRDGVKIERTLQKAFLGYHARHMIPTLAGIMLDMEFRAGTSAIARTVANFGVTSSSWLTFWQYNKMTGNLRITPRVNTHAHALVGIHTPLVRVGIQMKLNIRSYFDKRANVVAEKGKQCSVKFNIPDRKWDVWTVKVDTEGFTQECNPDTLKTTDKAISMELNRDHITQLQRRCYGKDMFGVQYCVEGTFPDLTALRLQQVQVLPVIGQFDGRFTGEPAEDKPTDIEWLHKHPVISKLGTQEINGEINVLTASKAVTRKIPYKITYKRGHQRELLIKFDDLQVKGYEKAMMTLKVDSNGLKLNFGNEAGKKEPKYEITVSGQVENQGKCLRARAHWNMLPEQWKEFFYQWEPQIWNALQQFAWVRRVNQKKKQMEFQIQLKTATTADWELKAPNADVKRTNVRLPLRVERFASSYDDIMNFVFARCDVQGQNIRVFDHLQYVANIKAGCPYVLVQEHNTDRPSRIMMNGKGQKTLRILISKSKERVEIKANDDHPIVLIDGQLCTKQDCQTKLQEVTVHTAQMPGGKNQVDLHTKFGLCARINGGQISVYASPLLQGHVRGLCGDANGEQWNEFRDRNDKIQDRQTFVKSWQQKC